MKSETDLSCGFNIGYTARMKLRFALLAPILILALGCDGALAVHLPEPAKSIGPVANDRFEARRSGTVAGTVKWVGDVPAIHAVKVYDSRPGDPVKLLGMPHPNAPRVSESGELLSAVVYLRGIDLRRSKSVEAISVSVELESKGLSILRDGKRFRATWAPVGSEVRLANRLDGIGGIRARGAEFFSQMFPKRGDSAVRTMDRTGRSTFTSASGQFWAVADLFVSDHPYIANVDESGKFHFDQVPDGEYELVAWHPNWHVAGHELDPETGVVARQSYAPPVESRTVVRVVAGATLDVKLAFVATDFKP